MSRTVRLTATRTRFSASDDELELEPERVTLEVPLAVWVQVVSAAQAGGFLLAGGHLPAGRCKEFAASVRRTLGRKRLPPRRASLLTAADAVNEFFSAPANRKLLRRVLALVYEGHDLSVDG